MPVPETTTHKNYRLPLLQNDIRLAGQIPHMQTEAEPCGMKHLPDRNFRFRILATNPAHVP